uniref:Uncharacterized protein n=1 Tax=Oryza meridionalis TaxID=40149 RepID=A0A0E0E8G9_9ORYZ
MASSTAAAAAAGLSLAPAAPWSSRATPSGRADERLASWAGMSVAELAEVRRLTPPWFPSMEEVMEFDTTDFSPAAMRARFRRESVEAAAALRGAAAAAVRPLRELARDVRGLASVFHVEEFHVGMPFGAAMTCLALWQLWRAAPSVCLDAALAYAFYKLSVMAADLRRQGFCPDLLIRLKLVIMVVMYFKDINKNIIPLDYIRISNEMPLPDIIVLRFRETAELRGAMPPWFPSLEELLEYEATDFSPTAQRERFRPESGEAAAALRGAAAGAVRPLRELARDVRGLESALHVEEFHVGMPFGAAMACLGLWRLWRAAPAVCVDAALAYAFYKLSVMAADLRRRGFSPDLLIRLKFVITIIMLAKDFHKKIIPLDYIRLAIFFIYLSSVWWEMKGLKKYAKYCIPMLFKGFDFETSE